MAPKARTLVPPCSNLRSFGSKCAVLKKVLVTLLELFSALRGHSAALAMIRRPRSDSAPGELWPPCPPLLRPCMDLDSWRRLIIISKQITAYATITLQLLKLELNANSPLCVAWPMWPSATKVVENGVLFLKFLRLRFQGKPGENDTVISVIWVCVGFCQGKGGSCLPEKRVTSRI